jgi:hypothetical protein
MSCPRTSLIAGSVLAAMLSFGVIACAPTPEMRRQLEQLTAISVEKDSLLLQVMENARLMSDISSEIVRVRSPAATTGAAEAPAHVSPDAILHDIRELTQRHGDRQDREYQYGTSSTHSMPRNRHVAEAGVHAEQLGVHVDRRVDGVVDHELLELRPDRARLRGVRGDERARRSARRCARCVTRRSSRRSAGSSASGTPSRRSAPRRRVPSPSPRTSREAAIAQPLHPRRALVGARRQVDADAAQHALHRHEHVLPGLVGRDEVGLEPQRPAVTVEHAVAVAVGPAGLGEQAARARRVVRDRSHAGRVLPAARAVSATSAGSPTSPNSRRPVRRGRWP